MKAKERLPVICSVIDKNPRFQWEFLVWSYCLINYIGLDKIHIKVYWIDSIPNDMLEYSNKNNIEVVVCKTYRYESPHCNKIIPFLDKENQIFSHIVVTDSDLFFVEDFTNLLLPNSIRLAPNNHNNPPIEIYHKLLTRSRLTNKIRGGLSIFENKTGSRESYINNNSAGIIAISNNLVNTFSKSWVKWSDWLIENRKLMSHWAVHVDQVGIAMACEEIGIDINFLPPQVNTVLELLKKTNHTIGFHIAKTHREFYMEWFNDDWTFKSNKFSPFLAKSIYKLNQAIREANKIGIVFESTSTFVQLRNSNKIKIGDDQTIYNIKTKSAKRKNQIKKLKLTENKKNIIIESNLFDREYYASHFNHLNEFDENIIDHYINIGSKKGVSPNPNFDFYKYRGFYKEVGLSKLDPFIHYCYKGLESGFNPEPNKFDIYKSHEEILEEEANIVKVNHPPSVSKTKIRTIAFYLPQFHEIEENNKWWGKGFTEWTHVKTAIPNFKGHYANRIPSDLGYYDLMKDKQIADRQIELALNSGIEGFAFYYYAFNDRIIMNKPIENFRNKKLSYCIFWANHPWTRTWYGQERELLLSIDYNKEFYLNFIKSIEKYLRDDNYIRINGKPLIMLLHHRAPDGPPTLEECAAMISIWRNYCMSNGIGEVHISFAQLNYATDYIKVLSGCDFDSTFEFCPTAELSGGLTSMNTRLPLANNFKGSTFLYDSMIAKRKIFHENVFHKMYPCVTTSWDNTARYGNKAKTFVGATPEKFEAWIEDNINYLQQNFESEEQIMFINGWNEWSEGSYLEPDEKNGYAYLNSLANSIELK